jgi:pimeloyl-ACP methyl ester carboxylesterase
MPRANANGIELEYDTIGDPSDPALLLVMGFTAQLTAWDEGFCKQLADRGFHVIRFDNRDCGLSTKLDGVTVDLMPFIQALTSGSQAPEDVPVPYTLSDMAADAVGLLDALGIERAHIAGASMGGMIVQTMAIERPERVATMTSIMSTTGEPSYGRATPEATAALLSPPAFDRDGAIARSVEAFRVFASKKYYDPVKVAERAGAAFDRSFYPEGIPRQLAGVLASGDRAAGLAELDVPTLVIHGVDDTLITPSGGERTAELVPGSKLLMLKDMGHDLPEPLWPFITDVIAAHAGS